MKQYFEENPALLTDERMLPLDIFGHHLKFLSNNGLFSCDKVDGASIILLENMPPITGHLLDLGCGYGVLGIALGKKQNITLTMADINGIALDYATRNAALNHVAATPIQSNSFENIPGQFNNIVLNPPIHAGKDTMYRMYKEAAQHLIPGGALYIVIYKKHGAESTIKTFETIFDTVEILYKKKGCFVVAGRINATP